MMLCKNTAIARVHRPMRIISATEYLKVNLNKSDSLPTSPTSAQAIAMLCGLIILPTTPPTELAARNSACGIERLCAATCCNGPKRRLELVSEPVKNTPIQPIMGLKNGNAAPVVWANASPRVALIALFLAMKAKATTSPIVMQGIDISLRVSQKHSAASLDLILRKNIVKKAASKIAVPAWSAMRLIGKLKEMALPASLVIAPSILLKTSVICV